MRLWGGGFYSIKEARLGGGARREALVRLYEVDMLEEKQSM